MAFLYERCDKAGSDRSNARLEVTDSMSVILVGMSVILVGMSGTIVCMSGTIVGESHFISIEI
jgi:hypothetical protein